MRQRVEIYPRRDGAGGGIMKKFLKSLSLVLAVMCAAAMFAACGETGTGYDDDDTNWDHKKYVVYVYYPDGTPVEGMQMAFCNDHTCATEMPITNQDGRLEFTWEEAQTGTVSVHFNEVYIEEIDGIGVPFPAGYTYPAGSVAIPSLGYEHAWILTEKVTKLTLTAV